MPKEYLLDGSTDDSKSSFLSEKRMMDESKHIDPDEVKQYMREQRKKHPHGMHLPLIGVEFNTPMSREEMVQKLLDISSSFAEDVRSKTTYRKDEDDSAPITALYGGGLTDGLVVPAEPISSMAERNALFREGIPAILEREKATRFAFVFEAYGYAGDDDAPDEEKAVIERVQRGEIRLQDTGYGMELVSIVSYDAVTDMGGMVMRRVERDGMIVRLVPMHLKKVEEIECVKLSENPEAMAAFGGSNFARMFEVARANTLRV